MSQIAGHAEKEYALARSNHVGLEAQFFDELKLPHLVKIAPMSLNGDCLQYECFINQAEIDQA
jgi:hypothetical protein